MKLTTKVVFTVITTLSILMAVMGYLLVSNTKSEMSDRLYNEMALDSNYALKRLNTNIEGNIAMANIISKKRDIAKALDLLENRGINQILNSLLEVYPLINYILILDEENTVFATSTVDTEGNKINGERLLLESVTQHPMYKGSKEGKTVVSDILYDPYLPTLGLDQHLSQWFIAEIKIRGRRLGKVIISTNWTQIAYDLLGEVNQSIINAGRPLKLVLLTDMEDKIYASYAQGDLLLSNNTYSQGKTYVQSQSELTASNTLDRTGAALKAVVVYDKDKAFQPIYDSNQFVLLSFITGSFIIATVIVVLLRKLVLHRLALLHRATYHIGQGDLDINIPSLGKDELAELGQAINGMVDGLQSKTTSIERLNEEIFARKEALKEKEIKDLQLSEANKYIKGISDNAPQLFSYVDKDLHYRFVNRAYQDWFGLPENEILNQHIKLILGEKIFNEVLPYLEQSLAGKETQFESRIDAGLGQSRHIRATYLPDIVDGEVAGVFVSVEDLTNIKESEEKLKETVSLMETILHSAENGLLVTDKYGHFLKMNQQFCQLWQLPNLYTEEGSSLTFIHQIRSQLVDPSSFTLSPDQLNAGSLERSFDTLELRNGKVIERISHPMLQEGTLVGRVWSFRDITDQIEYEKTILDAKNKAVEAAKAKSEFLANMSHEIRTPMNGVLGMLDLINKNELTDNQSHYLNLAQSSAKSLLTIIDDILDFSKIDAGKLDLEEVNFNLLELLNRFKEINAIKAQEKQISFHLDTQNVSTPSVKGDPTRLLQILNNLVGNAFKFTDQGEIKVDAQLTKAEGELLVFQCSVTDSGIGIKKEQLSVLFDAFTQADTSTTRQFGGTGLGLSITKQLCLLMGGSLEVSSQLGQGSTFSFSIQLREGDATMENLPHETAFDSQYLTSTESKSKPEQHEAKDPYLKQAQNRILLVEDNDINQIVAQGMLENLGIRSDIAGNGLAALQSLQSSTPYQLILMDCQMPEMDGYEATMAIRDGEAGQNYKSIPIIAMTANAMKGDMEKCLAAGMNDYISKPVNPESLESVLSKWLNFSSNSSISSNPLNSSTSMNEHSAVCDQNDPIWDEREALHMMFNDKGALNVVLSAFMEETPEQIHRLISAIDNGDVSEIKVHSHTLKGTSSQIGAHSLYTLMDEIEKQVKSQNQLPDPSVNTRISEHQEQLFLRLNQYLS
ncbi:hypothetical protein CW749_11150 [Vibrio sp. vnigr-6D03]|uniref:ATP-binding protein n=1 Tax=Vibrio sp. vnigr-6D03 TaxID=2058088 RepID=UPI000C332648|nr:ATP-binding protein [Vibrio sp. vnigr-6D03]PKF79536.1 hypothetical protein CW749_11150 [Vibrio sp. vnigr-6D03]